MMVHNGHPGSEQHHRYYKDAPASILEVMSSLVLVSSKTSVYMYPGCIPVPDNMSLCLPPMLTTLLSCKRYFKLSSPLSTLGVRRTTSDGRTRHSNEHRDEAVKIQSLARARASRREASLRYRRHGAATHIQCCGRRMLARKELKTRKRARDSVISLQCWARGLAATRTVDRRREQHRYYWWWYVSLFEMYNPMSTGNTPCSHTEQKRRPMLEYGHVHQQYSVQDIFKLPKASHWVWCAPGGQLHVIGIASCKRDNHERKYSVTALDCVHIVEFSR